jgi:hypothetical protein
MSYKNWLELVGTRVGHSKIPPLSNLISKSSLKTYPVPAEPVPEGSPPSWSSGSHDEILNHQKKVSLFIVSYKVFFPASNEIATVTGVFSYSNWAVMSFSCGSDKMPSTTEF